MSKLRVNELDTRSGTTITVAAGKTIAGTDIIGETQIAADAVTAAKIVTGAVGTTEIAANAVTLAEMAGLARGKLIVGDSSGDPSALTVGTTGQYLTSDGSDASWGAVVAGTSWQAVQTAAFTAVAGNGYPCNTTSAEFTVTLPSSASVGDWIELVDYAGTFDTNKITLDPNGLKLKGGTVNLEITTEREGVTITYVDVTQGWVATSGANTGSPALSPLYSVDFVVVAGGGGGAFGGGLGGGGGAGGYRTSTGTSGGGASAETSLTFVASTVYTIVVGAGAGGGGSGSTAPNGVASSITGSGISTITCAGGGGGGRGDTPSTPVMAGAAGGSGGGGGEYGASGGAGGAGTTNQGFPGEAANFAAGAESGGGGGAGEVGGADGFGYGGDGLSSGITGSGVYRGGGGGGSDGAGHVPQGGAGGGANGRGGPGSSAGGTANTGGGGAGAYAGVTGGTGGSGVVILSMDDGRYSGTTTGSPTVATGVSGKTVLTFNASGSYTG